MGAFVHKFINSSLDDGEGGGIIYMHNSNYISVLPSCALLNLTQLEVKNIYLSVICIEKD